MIRYQGNKQGIIKSTAMSLNYHSFIKLISLLCIEAYITVKYYLKKRLQSLNRNYTHFSVQKLG